jgi:uncharacterized protein
MTAPAGGSTADGDALPQAAAAEAAAPLDEAAEALAAEAAPPDPEFEAFDAVCRRLAGFDDRIDTEWVDGYLTALAASWRVIGVDEWLPAMCGDAFERAFGDPTDVGQAMTALGARLLHLRQALDPEALLDEPDALRLSPYMMAWDDEARARLLDDGEVLAADLHHFQTGAMWGLGFLDAVADFEADWPDPGARDEDGAAYLDMLLAVSALVLPADDEQARRYRQANWPQAEPTRDELVDEALFAVQDLRLWWIDHGPKVAPRRVDPAAGRNDPCPCGSGKKFKKCHGAAG